MSRAISRKACLGHRIVALLEHEGRHAEQAELARRRAEIVDLLLHGVADEDQRLHLGLARVSARACVEHLADLGVAAAAVDARHQLAEPLAARRPSARRGIRPARGNRRAAHRARRSRPPRGTCRPAAGRRCPRSAAGSWWRRARRSAGRACRPRRGGPSVRPALRNASISARGRRRRRRLGVLSAGVVSLRSSAMAPSLNRQLNAVHKVAINGAQVQWPRDSQDRSSFEDVVDFERLVLRREPFGARRRAPLAAFVSGSFSASIRA